MNLANHGVNRHFNWMMIPNHYQMPKEWKSPSIHPLKNGCLFRVPGYKRKDKDQKHLFHDNPLPG